jgi:thioredoxin-like negative regulator of GroEL
VKLKEDKTSGIFKFGATWCAACKNSNRFLETNHIENITLIDIDDNTDDFKKLFNITSIPFVVILKEGEVVSSLNAPFSNDKLKEFIG